MTGQVRLRKASARQEEGCQHIVTGPQFFASSCAIGVDSCEFAVKIGSIQPQKRLRVNWMAIMLEILSDMF
jgi:hypothetical protein